MKKDFYTLPVSLELPFLSDFQIPISFKDVLFVFCCFDISFSGDGNEEVECAGKQVV